MNRILRSIYTALLSLLIGYAPVAASSTSTKLQPTIYDKAPAQATKVDEQENIDGNTDNVYYDPKGLFSVPIPRHWTISSAGEYITLSSPQEKITIYILTIPGRDVRAAIAQSWQVVDPGFRLQPTQVSEIPSLGSLEQILAVTYESGDQSEEVVMGLGQLYEKIVYVGLIRADLVSFQKRAAQIRVIQTGFTIYAMTDTDLSRVKPLPVTAEITTELEEYITEAMRRFHIPGVAVALVQNDKIVYARGFGVRQRDQSEPVTPETLMLIGSTSKTMTTMMMASMVDDGLMAWDTPVVDILPSFAVADAAITPRLTMRHLVCACTGVPQRDFELFFHSQELSAERVIESLRSYELFTDFGETFQYSNQMMATGGYAAAASAGGQYGDLYDRYVAEMQQRVFDPIGMESTTFSFKEVAASANHATPHSVNLHFEPEVMPLHVEEVVTPVAPAGAVWSNVLDLGRYLITELKGGVAPSGERVVSFHELAETWKPQVAVSARTSYGLGWFVDQYKGLWMHHHGGNTLGFTSDLAFLPQADLGISVLTNAQGTNFFNEAVRFRLLELVFQQEHKYDAYASFTYKTLCQRLADPMTKLSPINPTAVAPYLGWYVNEALGAIKLTIWGNRLILEAGEAAADLRPQLDQAGEVKQYVVFNPPMAGLPVRLEMDEAGHPIVVLGAGVTEYRFEHVGQMATVESGGRKVASWLWP